MTEWHEKFKNVADGVKNLLIGLAVVIGGFWALYEFSALQRVERAKAELESLAKKNYQQGVLEINIEAQEVMMSSSTDSHILGTVKINNIGTRNVTLEFPDSEPPITVAHVRYNNSTDKLEYGTLEHFRFSDYKSKWPAATALVGRELAIPFMVSVGEPGMYMVTFRSIARAEDDDVPHDLKGNGAQSVWLQQILVNVKEKQPILSKGNLTK